MALVTPTTWSEWANVDLSDPGELASVTVVCQQVDQAIKVRLNRVVERTTITGLVLDAPDTPFINLGFYAPVLLSGFSCYLNPTAAGDPDAFTSNDLLTMYTDYRLNTDPVSPLSSPGILERIGMVWGISYRRRPIQLALGFNPGIGAVKLSFTCGYETVPTPITQAAMLLVSQTLGNRKSGYQIGSESWNGYSYNIPGVGLLANGNLGNPDILGMLMPYINYAGNIG